MGCSASKWDDEAVQICRDRKNFIKQAIDQRTRFASGHLAYLQSLKRVSLALRVYIDEDEHVECYSDSYLTPPFTPEKKICPQIVSVPLKSLSAIQSQSKRTSNHVENYLRSVGNVSAIVEEKLQSPETIRIEIENYENSADNPSISVQEQGQTPENFTTFNENYLRSSGNPSITIEEARFQFPETVRIESYSPVHQTVFDGFFAPSNFSLFSSSYSNRADIPPPPPPPQDSPWDFFWNPFSSLESYEYPAGYIFEQISTDDEASRLRRVREEEGIPDLEEEEVVLRSANSEDRVKIDVNYASDKVCSNSSEEESDIELTTTEHETKGMKSQGAGSVEVEVNNREDVVGNEEKQHETPGFTVYVNRRPTSMTEVIKDIETQFMIICDSSNEISMMLEANKAQYSSSSRELTTVKMLNPVALFRSASSRSSSSRFFRASANSHIEDCDSCSEFSEDSVCMSSGSHQSTLGRLYAWEKKLYREVRGGERIRRAYEKKCTQLRNQDVKGDDPSAIDKTRIAIRDLHTQIKVSIHSVESIAKRIETLRDQELQPQLVELIQGLGNMWRVMSECHRSQKRIIEAAKILLSSHPPSKRRQKFEDNTFSLLSLARSAANLESELRSWRNCFDHWITAQRNYARALTGWLLRCVRPDTADESGQFSPQKDSEAPSIFKICVTWSRFLDSIPEDPVLDGMDFFAAGIGSVYAGHEEDMKKRPISMSPSKRTGVESLDIMEMESKTAEKTAEVALKVLCAGLSVAIGSLMEFTTSSADGHEELSKDWNKDGWS